MIRVHCFRFTFTPRLVPTVFLLVALPLLVGLGAWQLQRAAYKRELQAQFQTRSHAALALKDINTQSLKSQAYRSIRITGHYDNTRPILIDNKILRHRVGYDVLTPFIPDNTDKIVMVNRGWIAGTGHRDQLPAIASSVGKQTIEGLIKLVSKKAFMLGEDAHSNQWPALMQAVDLPQFATIYRKPVYPFILLLSPKMRGGFAREWRPVVITSAKHVAYAVQWFALALTLVIIYLVLSTRREDNDSPRKTRR